MKLFDYNSKFMAFLRTTADLIILNVLYVLCSLPVVTIGASQAGLYTALREISDRDGNNSVSRSFFKGFKNGFGKITALWSAFLAGIVLLGYSVFFLYQAMKKGVVTTKAPIRVATIGLLLLCTISSQLMLFHSRFDCKPMQLLKNSIIMTFGHPIRSLLIGIVFWLPAIVIIVDGYTFIRITPLWIAIYYSLAGLISSALMNKPYEKIIYPNGKPQETQNENSEEDDESE